MKSIREILEGAACSVTEAARVLGVSTSHVYNEIGRGNLRTVRIGQRHIIPTEQIRAILEIDPPANGGE